MPPEIEEKMLRAEELKLKIKSLEEEYEKLRSEITPALSLDEEYTVRKGAFILKPGKSKWTFSPATTQKAEDLKKTQEDEKKMGIAVNVPGEPFVEYRVAK